MLKSELQLAVHDFLVAKEPEHINQHSISAKMRGGKGR